jgi:hypothetical protein
MKSRSMPAQDRLRSNDLAKVKQRLVHTSRVRSLLVNNEPSSLTKKGEHLPWIVPVAIAAHQSAREISGETGPAISSAARSWADCTINIAGCDLKQPQRRIRVGSEHHFNFYGQQRRLPQLPEPNCAGFALAKKS